MKNQALFSSKDKRLKCHLLQFLFGALRVNTNSQKVKDHKLLSKNPKEVIYH